MLGIELTPIIVALLAGGLLSYAAALCKWFVAWRQGATTEGRQAAHVTTVDQSLAVVARARDELEADNALLRATLAEQRAAHASEVSDLIQRQTTERALWSQEKSGLKAEIADLERRLREMLAEVENIRRRTS
jgi:molecular chaperone GrpE (heat shock protein)